MKLCECGCGQPTKIITKFCPRRGYVKGKRYSFVLGHRLSRRIIFLNDLVASEACTLWPFSKLPAGYGQLKIQRKFCLAHRIAYELKNGPIPDGLTIDHLCSNPSCVNPQHLEAVSIRINLLRGNTIPANNIKKTSCPSGHAYNSENTYVDKKGKRSCRICHAERERLRRRAISC